MPSFVPPLALSRKATTSSSLRVSPSLPPLRRRPPQRRPRANTFCSDSFSNGTPFDKENGIQGQPSGNTLTSGPVGFIVWGPPGSGKTTLCEALSSTYGLVHISTGALLRAHVLYNTEMGNKSRSYVQSITAVPDDIVIPMVLARLQQPDCVSRGFLLDGFPRNERQHAALSSAGISYLRVIMLHAPRHTLSRRIRYRRLDPETEKLYNLRLRPPSSQEILERLTILDKDRAANAAHLFSAFGRSTAETLHLLTPHATRIDADRPFETILEDVTDVLQKEGVTPLPRVTLPDSTPSPLIAAPPDATVASQQVPARESAALRARAVDDPSFPPLDDSTPITLIRCDGYMCEREGVDERRISFRGAATEQVMMMWNRPPSSVLLLVKKDPSLMPGLLSAAKYLMEEKGLTVVVEPRVQTQALANGLFLDSFTTADDLTDMVDFVICLGGDGLILHVSTLFPRGVPPVISFNLGSLGFLTPFEFEDFQKEIEQFLVGNCNLSLRMRLTCEVVCGGVTTGTFEVLNEVVVDRGASPYLSNLDCFCDGKYITTVQADGIIMSTPTGSTAYSMSAGGSMVHPSVPAILFTPICPHSLSFRPIVFPDSATLRIEISEDARSHAWASFDGKSRQQLKRGDGLVVHMNVFPVPTVNKTDHTGDWFQSLDRAFNFNSRAIQKRLVKTERPFRPAMSDVSDEDQNELNIARSETSWKNEGSVDNEFPVKGEDIPSDTTNREVREQRQT